MQLILEVSPVEYAVNTGSKYCGVSPQYWKINMCDTEHKQLENG